jgi:hypothetical protein
VGTGQDMLDLFGGDAATLDTLRATIAGYLGFTRVFDSVGQVYPRSLDYDVVSTLVQLAAAPSSLAKTIRLMVGHELATEGFRPGQVGSSAMPHKMNTRSSERVNGFAVILRGYASMIGELAGDQWNEGDVSCSVVRRVALPDAFFAMDGLFETFLTVLDSFGAYPAVIARELDRYLPFLATTKVLIASVRAGVGRETAHEAIKEQRPARPARRRRADPAGPGRARRAAGRPALVHRGGRRAGRLGGQAGRGSGRPAPGGRPVFPGGHPLRPVTLVRWRPYPHWRTTRSRAVPASPCPSSRSPRPARRTTARSCSCAPPTVCSAASAALPGWRSCVRRWCTTAPS